MRTRFLGTDYFFFGSNSKHQTLADPLCAPPLYLPPPDLCDPEPEGGLGYGGFVACDEIRLDTGFGGLSISKRAVSDLLSDLIPQYQDVEAVDREVLSEKELEDFLYGESNGAGFRGDASRFEFPDEWQLESKKLQFEILELDVPQTEAVRFCIEEDCYELHFDVPNTKIPLDIIELDVEVTIPYQEELLKSIYKVEKVPIEFDHADSYSKRGTPFTDIAANYIPRVPQFELKDVDWDQEYEKPIAKAETFNSVLSAMELCNGDHEQELDISLKQLLSSSNLDMLSYISKEPESEPCDEPRVLPLNSVLEMDLICLNDKILVDKKSAVYLLNSDGTHSDLPCAVLLPKVEMMDVSSDNNAEIISELQPTELDCSEVLLRDDTDQAKIFYESIVSSELTLVDETFTSLPTPILSDGNYSKPPSTFVQELLRSLEPHTFSASDGIFLDWHLLIQGTCEREICSQYKSVIEDVHVGTLMAGQELILEEGVVLNIIDLLEGSQEKMSNQNCEVHSEPHFGVSNSNAESCYNQPMHVSCTKEDKTHVQKEENNGNKSREAVAAPGLGKASMLFKSMSQSSDLNFFLGARRGMTRDGTFNGNSRNDNCMLAQNINMSKEQSKPAPVLIEPTQPFTLPKEPTKPDIMNEPLMKVKGLFQEPENASNENPEIHLPNFHPAKEKSTRTSFEPANENPEIYLPNYHPTKEKSTRTSFEPANENPEIYLPNYHPTKEKSTRASFEPANENPALNLPSFVSSRSPGLHKLPTPGVVVVVNTQCLSKPMLASRRSSYQKILALEKEDAHIVERDINLPLDLVFSAGVCLVWYETGTFGNISTNTMESASCIQMFMENIATNVLISLSYSFSSCVMIFEGEAKILAAVMDQSDTIYSAAANLDFNLQLLCSYNTESTDEIILTCIAKFTCPTRGLYPPMPESESLAESFLTKFPSINPLSAHAILSTGGALIDFLEWSNERRIQAVGKYLVPDESIALFSALCRYGEMGESKSVMTDCSSVDSDINSSLLQSPLKRKRLANQMIDVPIDDPFFSKPFEQFQGDFMELPHIDNQPKKSVSSIIDQFMVRKKGIGSCIPGNCDEIEIGQSKLLDFGFDEKTTHSGNVFDQEQAFGSDISSFSLRPVSRSKLSVKSSLPTKGPEISDYSFRTFPTLAEMEDETRSDWVSPKMKCEQDDMSCFGIQRNVLQLDDRETKYTGMNSKKGPGWKFEFLGGGDQKGNSSSSNGSSKESHCKTRSPSIIDSYRYQGSKESAKRIEKYRYHGGDKDATDPLRQRWKGFKLQQTPMPAANKRKTSVPLDPSWTPVDKRARQNLSFTRNGKEKQSKLVWRRKDSPCISTTSLGKRSREQGHIRNF